jgi:hypothetical protein
VRNVTTAAVWLLTLCMLCIHFFYIHCHYCCYCNSVHGPLTNFKAKRRTKAVTADSDSDDNASSRRRSKKHSPKRGSNSSSPSKRKHKRSSSNSDDDDDAASDAPSDADSDVADKRSGKKRSQKGNKRRSRAGSSSNDGSEADENSDDNSSDGSAFKSSSKRSGRKRSSSPAKRGAKGKQQRSSKHSDNSNNGSGSEQGSDDSAADKRSKRARAQQQQQRKRANTKNRNNNSGSDSGGSASSSSEGEADRMLETEISCGWVLVPLAELAAEAETGKRVRYQLQGGTPFARSDINRGEVMTRRYGWRAVLKAMKVDGVDKSSEIELKVIPVRGLPVDAQEDALRLPRNIVIAASFAPLVRYYREALAHALAARSSKGSAGFGCGGAFSCPVLALFPRLAADTAMQYALASLWLQQRNKHGPGVEGRTKAFEHCVLRAWPAHSHIAARRGQLLRHESLDEQEARAQRVRSLVMAGDSFRADTPTNSAAGLLGRGSGGSSGGVLREEQLFVAFSTKEVAFGA